MIVDPDFLEHWKTRMLVDMLGDESAPLFVIRLWGHCQNRREWVFDGMPIHATKAICRYQGEAQELEDALIACGFLERKGSQITIVGWDEHNASLIANWKNGSRGGRPKKNQGEKDKKPMGSPSDNPSLSDKIGLDKIGSDSTKDSVPSKAGTYTPDFEEIWKLKPKREGGNPKAGAFKAYKARLKQGATSEEIRDGVIRYKEFCEAKGLIDTDKVQMMQTFLGPNENFRESWTVKNGVTYGARQQGFIPDTEDTSWAEGFDPTAGAFDDLSGSGSDQQTISETSGDFPEVERDMGESRRVERSQETVDSDYHSPEHYRS